MVNRSILIVRAKQPFLEWLRSLPDPANITLDEVNSDNTAYLIQDYKSDDEREKILTHCYDLVFEDQLAGWWRDETDWPEIRDMETFKEWFDIEFHSLVIDLVDGPLGDED